MLHVFQPEFGKGRYVCKPPNFNEYPGVYLRTSKELSTSLFLPFTAFIASFDIPLKKVMEFFESGMARQTYKDLKQIMLENLSYLPYNEEEKVAYRELASFPIWPGESMKEPQAEKVRAIRQALLEDQSTSSDLLDFLHHLETIKRNSDLQRIFMDATVIQMDRERSAKRQKRVIGEEKKEMKKPSEDPVMNPEDVNQFFASIEEDDNVTGIAGGVQGMQYSEALGQPFTGNVVCVYPPMRKTLGRASDSFVRHKIAVSPHFEMPLPDVQNFLNSNIYGQEDVQEDSGTARKLLEETKEFNADLRIAMHRMGIPVPRRRKQKVKTEFSYK